MRRSFAFVVVSCGLVACSDSSVGDDAAVDGGSSVDGGGSSSEGGGSSDDGGVRDAQAQDGSAPPGDGGGRCGDLGSPQAMFASLAGGIDATIAASGGSMASLFGGTYRIFVVGASAGVLIEQITPTRSAPYQGFAWGYGAPPDSFKVEANEVNVMFERAPGTRAIFQCELATGAVTLAVSDKTTPTSFVRLTGKTGK